MELKIQNIEQLPEVVGKFIETMDDRTVYAFRGEMGAGKTVFVRGFASFFNITDTSSPTFTIVNEYKNEKANIY